MSWLPGTCIICDDYDKNDYSDRCRAQFFANNQEPREEVEERAQDEGWTVDGDEHYCDFHS